MSIYEELKTAHGEHFQNLFSQLMKEKYGIQYQPTSTYGNIGDMCVDGVLSFNTAFAVYAPEIYNDSKTIEKLKSDFFGFLKHKNSGDWINIQKYIFVIKRERKGVTSSVLNLISEFSNNFPVDVMTMDDIAMLARSYLPFSEDGRMLLELKQDVTKIMEYIVVTDFAAVPFYKSLSDDIELGILAKWNKKQYLFKDERLNGLKNRIVETLSDLRNYLTTSYVHALPDGRLLFNNDSLEAGEQLQNKMRPQTYRIRGEVRDLLEELYNIS